MRIKAISVRNFRSIKNETLTLGNLTALAGGNSVGKSAFLRSLNTFYEGPSSLTVSDFYDRDTGQPIEIRITYSDLHESEASALAAYVEDGALSVVLRAQWEAVEGSETSEGRIVGSYHGTKRVHLPFKTIRQLQGAPERVSRLRDIVSASQALYGFTPDTAWARCNEKMVEWEQANPGECLPEEDEGGYFRPPNSGQGGLGPFTQLIFVAAVKDAADEAIAGRSNVMGRLVAAAVGQPGSSAEVQGIVLEYRGRYQEAIRAEAAEVLPPLAAKISEALATFAPDINVTLNWQGADVSQVAPRTQVQISDEGFEGDIQSKGHGLQRLFIVALLQLAASSSVDEEMPTGEVRTAHTVLAVEEPELYQHPIQARRFARVLRDLAQAGDGRTATQVLFSTHSPIFLSVVPVDCLRLARKINDNSGKPPVTRLSFTSIDGVMERIKSAFSKETMSIERFVATLRQVMTPEVAEGYFAKYLVLVEGAEDKAIVEAALAAAGLIPEDTGLAVIAADGKTNLDRPYAIFMALGIPCYLVFDADSNKAEDEQKKDVNLGLQRLAGEESPADLPQTTVKRDYAVFGRDLASDIREEIGQDCFLSVRNQVANAMGWDEPSHAAKNPAVLTEALRRLCAADRRSPSLDAIVSQVRAMVTRTPGNNAP